MADVQTFNPRQPLIDSNNRRHDGVVSLFRIGAPGRPLNAAQRARLVRPAERATYWRHQRLGRARQVVVWMRPRRLRAARAGLRRWLGQVGRFARSYWPDILAWAACIALTALWLRSIL